MFQRMESMMDLEAQMHWRITLLVTCLLQACTTNQNGAKFNAAIATAPADSSIVGTWRFASAGDQKIVWPFLMKFDKHGKHTSGPTPASLTQSSNYTFDGKQIVLDGGQGLLVIPNVTINGNVMQFYGGPGAEDTLLTYHRIFPR
jgi:hypothetical protein